MNRSYCLKPNLFVVEHGKLKVRQQDETRNKKNYRYIPYDPVNNPEPQDYFRETISQLKIENSFLKGQINKMEDGAEQGQKGKNGDVRILENESEVEMLKRMLKQKNEELKQVYSEMKIKDEKVRNVLDCNRILSQKIEDLGKKVNLLNSTVSEQNKIIKKQEYKINEYVQILQSQNYKQKSEGKTRASLNLLATPKTDLKQYQQFQSECRQSIQNQEEPDRYLTPRAHETSYLVKETYHSRSSRPMNTSDIHDYRTRDKKGRV